MKAESTVLRVFIALIAASALPGWDSAARGSAPFEDEPSILQPKVSRDEQAERRVRAAALYARGRMLYQRQDYAGALRHYQRAWRNDESQVSVLREIVGLAFELKRHAEAARYAVLAAERDPRDPVLLRQLAAHLSSQREWARAARLYEAAARLESGGNEPDKVFANLSIQMELGRLYYLVEDYDKAAGAFAIVMRALKDPDKHGLTDDARKILLGEPTRTYELMAEAFLEGKRWDDAEAVCRWLHDVEKEGPLLAYRLARVEQGRGKHEAALEQLETYFAADDLAAGIEAYELLANLIGKKYADADAAEQELVRRLESLYADHDQDTALRYFLARQRVNQDRPAEAIPILEDVLAGGTSAELYQLLAEIHLRAEDLDALLRVFGAVAEQTATLEPLADAVSQLARNKPLLRKFYDHVSSKRSDGDEKLGTGSALAVGFVALKAGEFDIAEDYFNVAFQDPDFPAAAVLIGWGLELFQADEFGRAAKVFQQAIDSKVQPANDAVFYYYLAGALEMAGQTDEALTAARHASRLRPESIRFAERAGWILYHARRYEEAEAEYQRLLLLHDGKHDSDEIRENMRDLRLSLSNVCVTTGRLAEAEEWIEQVLDEFPEDIGALNDLGYLWADQNKWLETSLGMLRKAVAGDPDNKAYRDSLGWVLHRLGRNDEALRELEDAADEEDPDGVILDHLGDVYMALGRRGRALKAWRQAVEQFRESAADALLEKTTKKIEQHQQRKDK